MSLIARLRRWLGLEKATPAPRPSSQGLGAPGGRASRVQYHDAPAPRPEAHVHWRRESLRVPRMGINAWARRATARQKLLVAGALVSLVALGISATQGLNVQRTLPAALHGYWTTDDERYAGLAMELRPHLVAFRTADSAHAVVVRRILSVRADEGPRGTSYHVVYAAEGAPVELQFRFEGGTPPQLMLVNQPHTTWRRLSNATMLPGGF